MALLALGVSHLLAGSLKAADRETGFRPGTFAVKHAQLVIQPGQVVEDGTLLIRDGAIEAAGPSDEVDVPPDAEEIDGTGLIAYAGFIDGFNTQGIESGAQRSRTGQGRTVDYSSFALGATPPDNRNGLTPEFQVADALSLDDAGAKSRREVGFTATLVAPGNGIATGQSALVSLSGQTRREIVIASPVALHVSLSSTGARGYPSTLMGFVSHLRQAMLDAGHYDVLWKHFDEEGGRRPPTDPTLQTLFDVQQGSLPVFWEANTRDEIHRALDLGKEFGIKPIIVGGREAWKVVDRLKAEDVSVVLSLELPDKPKPGSKSSGPADSMEARFLAMSLDEVKELLKRDDLPPAIRQRVEARVQELSEKETADASEESSEEGDKKPADEKPESGPTQLPESRRLLEERTRLWRQQASCAAELAKAGVRFCFSTQGIGKASEFTAKLRQMTEQGLSEEDALAALTTNAAELFGMGNHLGRLTPGSIAHVVVFDKAFHEPKAKLRYVFIDREKFELNKPEPKADSKSEDKPADEKPADNKPEDNKPEDNKPVDKENETSKDESADKDKTPDGGNKDDAGKTPDADKKKDSDKPEAITAILMANDEPFPSEIESDREPSFRTGGNVAIRGATVLTVTQGTLPKATILIRDGKIAEIGTDVEIPEGMHVIEAEGLTVMPGIIDSHSHFSISSGVNEATLAVVPEVRIRDAINSDDITIYRALAGGVTAARLLHGSANPIGGQDAVIKLRWGKPGRELLMDEGPRGVKFALGENPKRSTTRYPDTRLGVESAIRRSFEEGRMYARLWQVDEAARKQGENPAPPRRDLRLEALADIVQGDLRIHSHCYRADEILMLLRMAESYGIRIASLQHVLEGYKVAAEIAAHGASNSTFADWWAYKIEAYDAIPHNAALLNQAGADVVLKSDDQELMRHLYQEAAKTVRYGQMPVEDALATVTINAARQLKLDHRIGSIEVGKDADLAIFNGHPLNGYARCEITLVDGEVYFERRGPHEGSGHEMPVAAAELRSRELSVDDSPSGRYALVGARIVPGDGEPIPRGTVIISDGLIEAVGGPDLEIPEYAASIDLAGLSVYPGMINAGGSLGLTEIGSARETQDFRERGDYNEDLQASIAVHPDSELIPVSRANGITTVLTQPSGGTISGQSVLMNLHGWIPPEMAVVDPMALHVNFPSGSIGNDTSSAAVKQRKKVSDQIDELSERFRLAIRYDDLQHHAKEKDTLPPAPDPKLHALVPYARGQCPVVVHASSHGDILAAIDWAESLELDWILADAGEAWKCTDALKQHNVKVILGPSMRLPGDADEPYDSPYANAAALYDAGVMFAIKAIDSGPGSATSTRNLPFQAAMAVAYGLPVEEGLKAVTLYPAQILGVEDQLGSIAPGKIANLVITDGDMLQPVTQVKWLFVGGRPVSPENRHTHLFERYRHRLDEVRAGRAPLGVGGEVPVSD